MSTLNFIYSSQFDPHKNKTIIYEEQGLLHYSANKTSHKPAKLVVIRNKVEEYIKSGVFKNESPDKQAILLNNVKILNNKIDSHNNLSSLCCSRIIAFILRLFGLWMIERLSSNDIETFINKKLPELTKAPIVEEQVPLQAEEKAPEPKMQVAQEQTHPQIVAQPIDLVEEEQTHLPADIQKIQVTINSLSTAFVGKDKSEHLARRLSTLEGEPIEVPPSAFTVELRALNENTIFPLSFLLPSTFFEECEQGDEISFRYDGKPCTLVLDNDDFPFEWDMKILQENAHENQLTNGCFDDEKDSDDTTVVKELLKDAKYFTLSDPNQTSDGEVSKLSCAPLKLKDWKALRPYLKPQIHVTTPKKIDEFHSSQDAFYVREGSLRHYSYFFYANELNRKSLRILTTENRLLIVGDLNPSNLEFGKLKWQLGKPSTTHKELLKFHDKIIQPETVTVSFDAKGQLILKFTCLETHANSP